MNNRVTKGNWSFVKPGDWPFDKDMSWIEVDGEDNIADINYRDDEEERLANGYLMASSKKLYEFAETVMNSSLPLDHTKAILFYQQIKEMAKEVVKIADGDKIFLADGI